MKSISLGSKPQVAAVDDQDFERVSQFKWHLARMHGMEYARSARGHRHSSSNPRIFLHRFILNLPPGKIPQVDHRDRNGLNCQRYNMRIATQVQNSRHSKHHTLSGFTGVSKLSPKVGMRSRPWVARLYYDGKSHLVGFFSKPEEAARARDLAAREQFGEFAYLNFPEK